MMFCITRSWGVFFYSLLAVLLCGGYEARACLSSPDEIKVPGSTFTAERITAGKTLLRGISSPFSISFGDTNVYHNGTCWYYHEGNRCLTQMVSGGGSITITPKNHQTGVGVLKWDDRSKKLWVYSASTSVSADGTKQTQQDPRKPYLEFHEHEPFCNGKRPIGEPCPEGVNLTGLAYSHENGRIIGKYVSRYNPNGPQARGLEGGVPGKRHTGVIHLGNNKAFFSSGCHVNVMKRM